MPPLTEEIEWSYRAPKFKVGDRFRIDIYKKKIIINCNIIWFTPKIGQICDSFCVENLDI